MQHWLNKKIKVFVTKHQVYLSFFCLITTLSQKLCLYTNSIDNWRYSCGSLPFKTSCAWLWAVNNSTKQLFSLLRLYHLYNFYEPKEHAKIWRKVRENKPNFVQRRCFFFFFSVFLITYIATLLINLVTSCGEIIHIVNYDNLHLNIKERTSKKKKTHFWPEGDFKFQLTCITSTVVTECISFLYMLFSLPICGSHLE